MYISPGANNTCIYPQQHKNIIANDCYLQYWFCLGLSLHSKTTTTKIRIKVKSSIKKSKSIKSTDFHLKSLNNVWTILIFIKLLTFSFLF